VKESVISAYHNYRVNGMICSGFVLGDPDADQGFYFLADMVEPPQTRPSISARLFDRSSAMTVEILANHIITNPGGIVQISTPSGYRLLGPAKKIILEVSTRRLTNSYGTSLKARLVDEHGKRRMEPQAQGVAIYDAAIIGLKHPFRTKESL
jgi:hypothetical protein